MSLNVKTLGVWFCNVFVLILLPLSWVYAMFLDEKKRFINFFEWVLSTPDSFLDFFWGVPLGVVTAIFLLFPLFYFFIVGFYSFSTGHPFSHLSFSYIKAFLYLLNKEFFYRKLFSIFDELFVDDVYKEKEGTYDVAYLSSDKTVLLTCWDDTLNAKLCFRLKSKEFDVEKYNKKGLSTYLSLKEHDRELYETYYRALLEHVTKIDNKQKEKEALIREKEQEKERIRKEKEQQKEEEFFDRLLSTLTLMRKRRITYLELSNGSDHYTLSLEKRTILVTKNQDDVLIKCTFAAGKPVVYLQDETKESKNYQKLVSLYERFLSKDEVTH